MKTYDCIARLLFTNVERDPSQAPSPRKIDVVSGKTKTASNGITLAHISANKFGVAVQTIKANQAK